MPKIERSALVNHSAEQMFDLVNDIESYPEFMHGCRAAKVISQSDDELVGELTLGQPGIQQTFTTRNQLSRPDSIEMKLVSGQFKSFTAAWQFDALDESACKVSLHMDFEFDLSLMDVAASHLFSSVANAQVDALVRRANKVYGIGI